MIDLEKMYALLDSSHPAFGDDLSMELRDCLIEIEKLRSQLAGKGVSEDLRTCEIRDLRKHLKTQAQEHEVEHGKWNEQHEQQHHVNLNLSKRLELAEAVCKLLGEPIKERRSKGEIWLAIEAWREAVKE